MHRVDTTGNQNGQFVGRDPNTGTPGTTISADWLNAVQEEITSVITEAGIDLDKNKSDQLLTAVIQLIDDRVGQSQQGTLTEQRVIELINEHAIVWG